MRSLSSLPSIIFAGVLPVSLIGVCLYSISATAAFLPLSFIPCPTLSVSILFMLFTPVSARRLACGLYADVILWCTPHFLRNSWVVCAVNCGPPSDTSISGMPKLVKASISWSRSSKAVPPLPHSCTIGHDVYASTISRNTFPARWK